MAQPDTRRGGTVPNLVLIPRQSYPEELQEAETVGRRVQIMEMGGNRVLRHFIHLDFRQRGRKLPLVALAERESMPVGFDGLRVPLLRVLDTRRVTAPDASHIVPGGTSRNVTAPVTTTFSTVSSVLPALRRETVFLSEIWP